MVGVGQEFSSKTTTFKWVRGGKEAGSSKMGGDYRKQVLGLLH